MSKYQLKPNTIITFSGQVYNAGTITDEIAEAYLEKFPKAIINFVAPKVAKPAPAKPLTAREKLIEKAVSLGVNDADKLSANKLKEAIADAELANQK